jgi:hypothetical protein
LVSRDATNSQTILHFGYRAFTAFNAPRTLNRFLPEGALMNNLVKDHSIPRKGASTKCAASTKKTALCPDSASSRRGVPALQPKGFHFTLHSWMGMVITFVIQRLHLFFCEFYLNHLNHLLNFGNCSISSGFK